MIGILAPSSMGSVSITCDSIIFYHVHVVVVGLLIALAIVGLFGLFGSGVVSVVSVVLVVLVVIVVIAVIDDYQIALSVVVAVVVVGSAVGIEALVAAA